MWVQKDSTAMAIGDSVYVVYSGSAVGKVRNDNTNAGLLAGARVIEAAASGDALVAIEFNLLQ